jgi:hypothetical protein
MQVRKKRETDHHASRRDRFRRHVNSPIASRQDHGNKKKLRSQRGPAHLLERSLALAPSVATPQASSGVERLPGSIPAPEPQTVSVPERRAPYLRQLQAHLLSSLREHQEKSWN